MTASTETLGNVGRDATTKSGLRVPPGPAPRKSLLDTLSYYASFYMDALGFVEERFERYGDIYYAPSEKSGGLYVLRHPDHLRELLSTQASKFSKEHTAFEQLGKVLGEGLLTSDGDTWKRQRRLVQPAFARSRLVGYGEVMVDEARKSLDALSPSSARPAPRSRDEFHDMSHEMMELTLRVVSRTLFGYDATGDVDAVRSAMRTLQSSLGTPDFLPKWMPSPIRSSIDKAIAQLDSVVFGLIRERARARKEPGYSPRADLLDMLLGGDGTDPNDVLGEREIRDQLMTLFLAGHETTSHALTWSLYLLSQNPASEERLAREVRTVLGDRAPTLGDLENMPFTEQVIKESMRLYPPAYVLARRASEDAEIGGYVVPKGSEVIAWTYMTHRDPRWFPDPLAFDPDRFSPAREATQKPFAFLPFGAGPRACIGKSFAMIEAQLILACAIQRYRFELAPKERVIAAPRITMHPKDGLRMRLLPR